MSDPGAIIGAIAAVIAIISAVFHAARNTTTREDLESKIRDLRSEREQAAKQFKTEREAAVEALKVDIRVAQKRADDAHTALALEQQTSSAFRERLAREMLRHDALDRVENRISQNVTSLKADIFEAIGKLSDRVELYTKAVLDAHAPKS